MKISEMKQTLQLLNHDQDPIEIYDPCWCLWLGVLHQAVLDIAGGLSAVYMDAKKWVANTEDYGVNSFISVCNTVDIDYEEARFILSNKKLRLVWVVDGVDYDTLKEAARAHGVSISAIRNWCKGQYHNEKYQYPPRKACGRELRVYGR